MTKKRTSMGRRKIEMKQIKNEASRQVCFSKRRTGLFKKATELSVLYGAEVAIIVFCPTDMPCSFGHPSVASVADRLLSVGRQFGWEEGCIQVAGSAGQQHQCSFVQHMDAARRSRDALAHLNQTGKSYAFCSRGCRC